MSALDDDSRPTHLASMAMWCHQWFWVLWQRGHWRGHHFWGAWSRGSMHISLGCTCAHNQDANTHVHKHAMIFTPGSGITRQLIIWRVLSYHGDPHCSLAKGLKGKWMITLCWCVFVCSEEISMRSVLVFHIEADVIWLSFWLEFLWYKGSGEEKSNWDIKKRRTDKNDGMCQVWGTADCPLQTVGIRVTSLMCASVFVAV